MNEVRAIRIGGHAFRYLMTRPRSGRVVSTFRHGFNVLFDEETDPGFVSIQTEDVPLHPWAVQARPLLDISEDEPVMAEAGQIRFRSGFRVTLAEDAVDQLKIKPYTKEEASRAHKRWPMIEEFVQGERQRRSPDSFQSQIDAILERWKETANPNVLPDLIGLGSGSTPSGDDVVVGMLAATAAFGKAKFPQELRSVEIQTRTHPASAQMIAAAVDGAFPELLGDLVAQFGVADATRAGIRQCIERVANQGATSGGCFLLGFVAAHQTTQHRE